MSSTPEPCDHCGELIMWLIHARTGKRAPITAHPHPELGNVIRQGSTYLVLSPEPAAAARADGTRLRVHHAATCTKAALWRTKPAPAAKTPSRKRARR